MRGVREALIWACLFITTIAAHNVTRRDTSGGSKRVVCYYTNWSVYRPGTAKFNPQNINPYLCTHLIYAFGGLTRENGLRPYDKYQDIEQGGYAKFTGLKTYNKQLKTMLAIGGWNEGSTRFSPLVASDVRRKEFVKNVVRFLRQNHFDGLDLDWEYPAFRDGGKPRDRDNYAQLVQELREEFDRESSKTGRPRLLLTMAVPAGIEYIDKGYDIPKLNTYLDFMNILSYDYHSSFEPSVNHHSPLYPLEEEGEYNFDAQLSIDYTINHYLKLGADQDKLVLGIPTYGRSYTLFNPDSTEIGAPADGPGEQGDATREKGYLAYYEICENLEADSEWKVVQPNPKAMGPYAYKGNQWVGYDDEDIVRKKARYVTEKGLGGIMYWAIDNDDFRGKCHGRPYPLIEAGKEAMLASSGTSNELDSTSTKGKGRPKPRVTTEEPPISNSGGGSSRPSSGKRRRPSTKTKTQEKRVSTTTSTTPAYKYPTSTPEPPTTPDPGSDFKCEDEGFFPHPRDCKKYFWCLDSGPSNLGIVAHQFTCPSGLFFNKAADSCDYTRNVVCNTKTTAEPVKTTTEKPATTTTSRSVRIASTSTTTTLAPEEEEEEYEEYDEEPEEDPKAIKELIDLIKKLGGIENLEKQLHLDGSNKKEVANSVTPPAISKKLYNRVLSQANVRGNSNANFYNPPSTRSSTPHTLIYKNRGRQNEGLENLPEVTAVRQEKPQYVTIRRERPTTPIPVENPEENEDEEEEDDDEVDADDADEGKKEGGKTSAREYVTIRRDRPAKQVEEEVTTPKYVSIRRPRPTKLPEIEEDVNDIPAALVEVTSEASTPRVKEESPVSRKKLSPFAPRTVKVGSVLESFRRKKKEEEVTVTTEEVNEEVVTVTTEASKPKVSEAELKTTSALTGSTLAYLEVTRGRGFKLSTTQSSLEDDLPNVNIYSAYTSTPGIEAKRRLLFKPSSTSEPPKPQELISVPEETVPPLTTPESVPPTAIILEDADLPLTTPESLTMTTTDPALPDETLLPVTTSESPLPVTTSESPLPSSTTTQETVPTLTTLESLPLSTTTQFTPTVTRVVTSESESATERHRISRKKYKGYYLNMNRTSPTSESSLSPSLVEKIMEVNRVTHVTFKDDFSVPFTRPISINESTTQLSIRDELNNTNGSDRTGDLDDTTKAPVVTENVSTLSTKRYRPPYRATSTKSPLPSIQRRRTTTVQPILAVTSGNEEDQTSSRRSFVPKRRGPYRPKINEDASKSEVETEDRDVPKYSRRPFTTTDPNASTERTRFTPQYRSRERKVPVTQNDDDDIEKEERVLEDTLEASQEEENQAEEEGDQEPRDEIPVSRRPTGISVQRPITSQREGNPIFARRPPAIGAQRTTERSERLGPQYRNRSRTTSVTPITDGISVDVPLTDDLLREIEQEENEQEQTTSESPKVDIPSRRPFVRKPIGSRTSVTQSTDDIPDDVPLTDDLLREIDQEENEQEQTTSESPKVGIPSRKPFLRKPIGSRTSVTQSTDDISDDVPLTDDLLREIEHEENEQEQTTSESPRVSIPSRRTLVRKPIGSRSTTPPTRERQLLSRRPTASDGRTTTAPNDVRVRVNPQNVNRGRKTFVSQNLNDTDQGRRLSTDDGSTEVSNESYGSGRGRVVKKIRKRPLDYSTTTSEPIKSRRVVKKIKKRPLNGTTTTSDPTTSQTKAPLPTSTLDALQYDSKKIGVESEVTSPNLSTESSYISTQVPLDGENANNTVFDEDLTSTPSPSEEFGTTVDIYGRQLVDYDVLPRHEVFETQDSSVSYEIPARGAHKFTLEDVIVDDSLDSKIVAKLTPQKRPSQGITRTRPKSSKDYTNFYDSVQNSVRGPLDSREVNREAGSKRRVVVKRKRLPDQNTSSTEGEDNESQGEVSSTTARSLRRPGGSFYANNRVRSRSTTTSTTTEAPAKSVSVRPVRRQQVTSTSRLTVNRRRKYGDTTASTVDVVVTTEESAIEPIATTVPTDDAVTVEPTRKFSFPRRRTKVINNTSSTKEINDANETSNSNNIKSKRVQLTVKAALHHVVDSQNEPSTINGIKSQNPVEVVDDTSSSLPDLANDAVVAIHNLATTPTRGTFRRKEVYSTFAAQTATTPIPPRISTTAAPFSPRRGTAVYVTSTAPPQLPQRDYDSFKPRPFTKITSASLHDPQSSSLEDYEYYDHGEGVFANPTNGKVKIHSDGYIECLDQGNFPHPFSCKKFISCAKMENTDVLGWEYTCPRHLSFDPIGGICNWSAGLGCKE